MTLLRKRRSTEIPFICKIFLTALRLSSLFPWLGWCPSDANSVSPLREEPFPYEGLD